MTDFYSDQLAEFRHEDTLKQREHADRLIFHVTLASTIITLLATAAAFWAAYEAHKARIDDERPFLAVDILPSSRQKSGLFDPLRSGAAVTTTIVAFGRSPARNLRVNCVTFSTIGDTSLKWEKTVYPGFVQFPFILPSRSIEILCPLADAGRDSNHPDLEGHYRTEFGVVQYSGDSKTEYQTPFCAEITIQDKEQDVLVRPCDRRYGLPDLK